MAERGPSPKTPELVVYSANVLMKEVMPIADLSEDDEVRDATLVVFAWITDPQKCIATCNEVDNQFKVLYPPNEQGTEAT